MAIDAENMDDSLNDLLAEIDAFLALRERAGRPLADASFSTYAARNGAFVERLRSGKAERVHPDIVKRVRAYIKTETKKYEKRGQG